MGKKVLILMAAAIVAAAGYFNFFQEPEITNFPSLNSGVVAFGDSLVEGVGSSRGGGFVSALSEELNIPILNLGRSGDTTASALARAGEITQRKPAVTIILLGGNDFLRRIPKEQTLENLERLIQLTQISGSAVLLIGLDTGILSGGGGVFEDLSKEYRTGYVPDILDNIFGKSELMSDAIHPNDAGYKLMAERIRPILHKLLMEQ